MLSFTAAIQFPTGDALTPRDYHTIFMGFIFLLSLYGFGLKLNGTVGPARLRIVARPVEFFFNSVEPGYFEVMFDPRGVENNFKDAERLQARAMYRTLFFLTNLIGYKISDPKEMYLKLLWMVVNISSLTTIIVSQFLPE